jgi:hypothetical protein
MEPTSRFRGRTTRFVLTGLLLLFLGIPFLGSSVMALLLSGSLAIGIPASLGILGGIYVLSGFQGALVAAAVAAALAVAYRLGRGIGTAAAVAAAAAVLAALVGTGYDPGFMSLSSVDLEPLTPLYSAAGFDQPEIARVFALIDYLSPGIGALQLAGGATLAAYFAKALLAAYRGKKVAEEKRFDLSFQVIWLIIACLILNMFGDRLASIHPDILRMARNVLVFMALPYALLGGLIMKSYLMAAPQMLIPGALVLVFAPPLFMLGLVILGMLDFWFDFRRRIEARIERMKNENSSG